jgi:hypothetical protein
MNNHNTMKHTLKNHIIKFIVVSVILIVKIIIDKLICYSINFKKELFKFYPIIKVNKDQLYSDLIY